MNWYKRAGLPEGWDQRGTWEQHVRKIVPFIFEDHLEVPKGKARGIKPYHTGFNPLLWTHFMDVNNKNIDPGYNVTFYVECKSGAYRCIVILRRDSAGKTFHEIKIFRNCRHVGAWIDVPLVARQTVVGDIVEAVRVIKNLIINDKGCNSDDDEDEPVWEPSPQPGVKQPKPVMASKNTI